MAVSREAKRRGRMQVTRHTAHSFWGTLESERVALSLFGMCGKI